MTDKNENHGETVAPEVRLLAALDVATLVKKEKPIYILLWTGPIARFSSEGARPQVVAIAVKHDETLTPMGDGLALWDFQPVIYRGINVTAAAGALLRIMGSLGGRLDGIERFLTADALSSLKDAQREAGLSFVVDLLGSERFDNGEALRIIWILESGAFYGGEVDDDLARKLLPPCEEVFTAETQTGGK